VCSAGLCSITRWNCCCAYRVASKPNPVLYSGGSKFKPWPRRRLLFLSLMFSPASLCECRDNASNGP